ncbi:BURP domain-containing protein BNM2A-like [Humulus lupulus]|uniref:BURP domain-containing protein BNM2A-like n=1 Tax=Humulus lupulus TaxID=3486 RepID=UPI002B4084F9|nr:BURP domain-containing protein BNM2A-like [Humulus lupulus]
MGLASCNWSLFLVLIILYFSGRSECQETNGEYSSNIRLPSATKEDHHHHHHGHMHMHNVVDDEDHGSPSSSSSHTHLDRPAVAQRSVYLNLNDIKVGLTKPVYFLNKKKLSPAFLGRQTLLGNPESIPFSSEQLPNFLRLFSVPQGSPQAKAMKFTLDVCESKPIEGETRMCATSFDSMIKFARGIFGSDGLGHGLTHLTTTLYNIDSNTIYQNYTILEDLIEISPPKMVACHLMEFPYSVYSCHSMALDSKLFKMSLRGQKVGRVESIVLCHMDTSQWDSDHPAFEELGFGPGMGPVCHFFPDHTNIVWLPSSIPI